MNATLQSFLQDHLEGTFQKTVAMTALPLLAAAAVVFFLLMPAQKKLLLLQKEIAGLDTSVDSMRRDVAGMQQLRATVQEMAASRDRFLNEAELIPMFNSFAVRGKQKLASFAGQTGFDLVTGHELSSIPLRPPQGPLPAGFQFYGRQPVEFSGSGSYAQTTAFIQRVERAFPFVALYKLSIQPQPAKPKVHKVSITFEWPVKGEKFVPPKGIRK